MLIGMFAQVNLCFVLQYLDCGMCLQTFDNHLYCPGNYSRRGAGGDCKSYAEWWRKVLRRWSQQDEAYTTYQTSWVLAAATHLVQTLVQQMIWVLLDSARCYLGQMVWHSLLPMTALYCCCLHPQMLQEQIHILLSSFRSIHGLLRCFRGLDCGP